jgi:hypothetical protein
MVTSDQALKKYGPPEKEAAMVLWDVPAYLEVGVIPRRLYCNKDLVAPLTKALEALIKSGNVKELKTWDGCFNIRKKKAGSTPSLHSWGIAIDVNAAWNGFGKTPVLSAGFVKCFTDAGFEWGGKWKTPDGMHFQLAVLP